MPTVLITGGTGLIGSALSQMLVNKGYEVIILTRHKSAISNQSSKLTYAEWNVEKETIDKDAFGRADYIIHLAGANIGEKRWTTKRKKEIVESRTKSGDLLIKALKENTNRVQAVVSASAIGWYGADTNISLQKGFNEDDPSSQDFLGKTCEQWEQAIKPAETLGKRLVIIRSAIVLSNNGGAYPEFKKPLKFGIAAVLGKGNQIISWVHIEDICRIYIYALENNISGTFNATAPYPISNKELMLKLAKAVRGKFFTPLHVPTFVLKLILGELSIEVLKSATISDKKIKSAGFQFLYPSIDAAINKLEGKI
ncbi:MAG TPA: TIGR01777 family oxidoreductase [Chitinophagaceae bacterium]|jgi:hypothetical protein